MSRKGLYARYVLPRLTDLTMSRKVLLPYRQRVIGGAAGRVLEIGIGSGLNLPLYGDAVEEVIGVDVSPELLAMAERAAQRRGLRVRLLEGSAEHLPSTIPDRSVDTVVISVAFLGSFLLKPLIMRPISLVWARIIESEKPVFTLIFGGAAAIAWASVKRRSTCEHGG